VPLDFLRRRPPVESPQPTPKATLLPEDVEAEEHVLKLTYRARTSQGVRMTSGPGPGDLAEMLAGVAQTGVEVVEPLAMEFQGASPWIMRPNEALQWINANHDRDPVTRHALIALESSDAVDPAFETLAIALLHGNVDTSGFPEYDALVGGVASHWDEVTGDMIVRAVVGWGGRGVRGDTDRAAQKTLAALLSNVLASQNAVGLSPVDRPMPSGGTGGLVCAHCGFASAHDRAFYCPKCGMGMLRG